MLISTALLLDCNIRIVYVLRQNCRAAGWRWDTKQITITKDNNEWVNNKMVNDVIGGAVVEVDRRESDERV
jgi:hypothetical protein